MSNIITMIINGMLKQKSSFKLLFMGLAKNTGKTTTLKYFLSSFKNRTERPIILLSTGYDGEDMDAITGLPKPLITISKGHYFITAECLISNEDECTILKKFELYTPFGQIIFAVALFDMNIAIVSPGHNNIIKEIISFIEDRYRDCIILVDGSLNRKSFLSMTDSNDFAIISTGNAYSTNIETQIKQLTYYRKLFSIPEFTSQKDPLFISVLDDTFQLTTKNKNIVVPTISSIFLRPENFDILLMQNNKIFYEQSAPKLILFTFNPFLAFNIASNPSKMINLIQSNFSDIPVVDIHQL